MTNENYVKGKLLEKILKYFLSKQGFQSIPKNVREHYGVGKNGAGLTLRGRGAEHQIDALGQFQFQIPFVYPIRLLCEAKCQTKRIGLGMIRNYVGVLKDISENYFIKKNKDLIEIPKFTDCAAIFSTSEFTEEAQRFAYAQGIYLVEVSLLEDSINNLIKNYPNKDKKGLLTSFNIFDTLKDNNIEGDKSLVNSILGKGEILFGHAEGIYPVVIISKKKFPKEEFLDTDEYTIKIHYTTNEGGELISFSIELGSWEGEFRLPRYLWEKHLKSVNYKREMIDLKKRTLGYIDIPIKIKDLRRIIRLNLNKAWLESLNEIQSERK